jgi:hypothetical protein
VIVDTIKQDILYHGKIENDKIRAIISSNKNKISCFVIEMLNAGRVLGKSTLWTAVWIGRFIERILPSKYILVERSKILSYFNVKKKGYDFGGFKCSDAKLRYLMQKKYGDKTKGMKADSWAALCLATYVMENKLV